MSEMDCAERDGSMKYEGLKTGGERTSAGNIVVGRKRPGTAGRESSPLQTFRSIFLSNCIFMLSLLECDM